MEESLLDGGWGTRLIWVVRGEPGDILSVMDLNNGKVPGKNKVLTATEWLNKGKAQRKSLMIERTDSVQCWNFKLMGKVKVDWEI